MAALIVVLLVSIAAAALLLALPAAARSCAIGALLVAQPLLDGVLVLAVCDERAPSGSGRVAVVSFSLE